MSKSWDAGSLDRRITLEQRTVTSRDPATGAELITYTPWRTLWASVEEFSNVGASEEYVRKGVALHQGIARIRIRWLAGVDTSMRVNLGGGRLLQISGMAAKGRRQFIELSCNEFSHE